MSNLHIRCFSPQLQQFLLCSSSFVYPNRHTEASHTDYTNWVTATSTLDQWMQIQSKERGTSPSFGHTLFPCSGPHKVSRTNMRTCLLMPLVGAVLHQTVSQVLSEGYKLAFSALMAAKVLKDPPSMTFSSWNRTYFWKLLPLLGSSSLPPIAQKTVQVPLPHIWAERFNGKELNSRKFFIRYFFNDL